MSALPIEPEPEHLAEVHSLESGILAAMNREAQRLARTDPRFSERTRERLRQLLST